MKLPRFTLRDLFWLVLVCAITTAWWVDNRRFTDKIASLERNGQIKGAPGGFRVVRPK